VACAPETAGDLLEQLHRSRTRPVCIDVLNEPAAQWLSQRVAGLPPGWLLIAGYEGNVDAVHWQVQQLIRELRGGGALEARVGATATPLWEALAGVSPPPQPGRALSFQT